MRQQFRDAELKMASIAGRSARYRRQTEAFPTVTREQEEFIEEFGENVLPDRR